MAASSSTKKKKTPQVNPPQRSSARSWKRSSKGEDLALPSGEVALVKRPGPAALLSGGLLPDSLTPIVMEAVKKGRGLPPEKVAEMAGDPRRIGEMMDAMDRMLVLVVVDPPVRYHRREVLNEDGSPRQNVDGSVAHEDIPDADRDPDFIYTDDVEMQDKMLIFNYAVGGTRDYERFREELVSGVGDIQSREAGADQPE